MSEEVPKELQDFDFAEIGNNQQNIWRLRDELNATRRWIRENTVTPEENDEEGYFNPDDYITSCQHGNSYQMRPGLMKCKDCKVIYKV